MRIRSDIVMSVEQARELLGDEALDMSDLEIKDLIEDFDMIAQYTIKTVQTFNKQDKLTGSK
jgi:hypothetical protein